MIAFAFVDLAPLFPINVRRAPFLTGPPSLHQSSIMPTNNHTGESYTVTSSGTNDQVSVAQLRYTGLPLTNL